MRPAARESGRSLIELVVTAMLLGLLSIAIMRLGPPMSDGTRKLEARARSVTELRLATEYLARDLGSASEATETVDGELHIVRVRALAERLGAWHGNDDDGLLYALDGTSLVRTDLALGDVIVVARDIDGFTVTEATDIDTRVLIESGEDLAERSLELVWTW